MKDDYLLELTIEKLRWLRLPGMARTLTDLIESAKQQISLRSRSPAGLPTKRRQVASRAPSTAA